MILRRSYRSFTHCRLETFTIVHNALLRLKDPLPSV